MSSPSRLRQEQTSASRRWRTVALLAVGIALGTTITAAPVYSHVGGTVAHLWTKHIRPQADKRYPTKAAAEARYVNVGEKASDAELFDGMDSNIFVIENTPASGDLTGRYPNPAIAPDAIGSAEVRDNSLTGGDILGDSIVGFNVNEASLGQVPTAANASTVNNQSVKTFNYNFAGDHGPLFLFTLGGLSMRASCDNADGSDPDELRIEVQTDTDDSFLWSSIAGVDGDADFDRRFDFQGQARWQPLFSESSEDKAGILSYRRGQGTDDAQVVTVTLAWDTNPAGNDCMLAGTVIGH